MLVGVELQALDDLGFQLAFLAAGLDGVQQGQHADRPSGRLGRADPGCWGGLQAAEQLADGRAAAVVQAAQEGSEAGLGEGGGVAGGIAAPERDGGWRVQLVQAADGAGNPAFPAGW